MRTRTWLLPISFVVLALLAGCARRQPPVARPVPPPPPPPAAATLSPPPLPTERIASPLPVPPEPRLADETIANRSLDDLNRDSPLQPVYFALDSSELDDAARAVVMSNAALLRRNMTWVVTIEGHCDERGTAEYNLALGERRAVAVRTYLLSLGIAAARVATVSYGNEFPFDPGHDEGAWSRNRRAQFVITSK